MGVRFTFYLDCSRHACSSGSSLSVTALIVPLQTVRNAFVCPNTFSTFYLNIWYKNKPWVTNVNLFNRLRRIWRYYLLRRKRIPLRLWRKVVAETPVLFRLKPRDRHRLRILVSFFLHRKTINGAAGLVVDDAIRVSIAAQACLLVLNLDLDYFDGWVEVIVYPVPFIVTQMQADESGVVHQGRHALGGEAWNRGPVILAWSDIEPEGREPGRVHNVVLHEFAHKLDMLNGPADGLPPLHKGMAVERWSRDFNEVYEKLRYQVEHLRHTAIDRYAAVSPAEFFAVVTEYFFEAPQRLHRHYPDIYQELQCFYRQDPMQLMR